MQVFVRDNNVDQALRALKRKLQREGVFREMKARKSYEKPSERKIRERAEAVRRARKLARKQAIVGGVFSAMSADQLPDPAGRKEFAARVRAGLAPRTRFDEHVTVVVQTGTV